MFVFQPSGRFRAGTPACSVGQVGDIGAVWKFLYKEGLYEEVTATAIKRVLARRISREMTEQHLSKAAMARRMQTSRAALDRLLDPENDAVTLNTLGRAASAVGREIRLELV